MSALARPVGGAPSGAAPACPAGHSLGVHRGEIRNGVIERIHGGGVNDLLALHGGLHHLVVRLQRLEISRLPFKIRIRVTIKFIL